MENIVEIDKVSTLRMGQRLKTWYNGNGVKITIEKFARFYTWKFCTCIGMVSYIGTDKGMTNL